MQFRIKTGPLILFVPLFLVACTPEFGSERWCEKLGDKPKMDWTAEELKGFTNYCIGRSPE
jgi:hypothetical protein